MTIDERIAAELRRHAPEVDEHMAWDRIRSAAPARRRSKTIRLVAMSAAAFGFVLLAFILAPYLSSDSDPAADAASPFLGTWATDDPVDGTPAHLVIHASEDGSLEMVMQDDVAFYQIVEDRLGFVCSGGAATTTGTGGLQAENELVFPAPVATCDDQPVEGLPPLEEVLENLTFTYDPETDTLTDNLTDNSESVWTRVDTELTEFLNGFLEARVAGEGAQQYLNGTPEEDIPLLYATSSGAPYERAEFEHVRGIQWPDGRMAVKARLFAGDTVVEQLVFWRPGDRLGLDYVPHGYATEIAPTTENGEPLTMPVNFFDGEVTLQAAHPWIFVDYPMGPLGRLIPEGTVAGTTDGGERSDWDEFWVITDPAVAMGFPDALANATIEGRDAETGCPVSPANVAALVESIQSYPGLEATAPVAVNAGEAEALMMDVGIAAGATVTAAIDEQGNYCENGILNPIFGRNFEMAVLDSVYAGNATGERMRLYLFDMPGGSSMRTIAIAIVAPESSFDRAVAAAAPVVESAEFQAP